jgi:hypothetical protein
MRARGSRPLRADAEWASRGALRNRNWWHEAEERAFRECLDGAAQLRPALSTSSQIAFEAMMVVSPFKHFALLAGPFVYLGLDGSLNYRYYFSDTLTITEVDMDLTRTRYGLSIALLSYWL